MGSCGARGGTDVIGPIARQTLGWMAYAVLLLFGLSLVLAGVALTLWMLLMILRMVGAI